MYRILLYLWHICARWEILAWAPWVPGPGPLRRAPRWPRTRTLRWPRTARKRRRTPTGVRWPATTWRLRGARGVRYWCAARSALRWRIVIATTRSADDWLAGRLMDWLPACRPSDRPTTRHPVRRIAFDGANRLISRGDVPDENPESNLTERETGLRNANVYWVSYNAEATVQ